MSGRDSMTARDELAALIQSAVNENGPWSIGYHTAKAAADAAISAGWLPIGPVHFQHHWIDDIGGGLVCATCRARHHE